MGLNSIFFTFSTNDKIITFFAKDKGHKFGLMCKQGSPMAFYEGALVMDRNPPGN
jgi:hypothetical protein